MAVPHELREPAPQIEVRTLAETGFVVPAGWYGFVAAAGGHGGRGGLGRAGKTAMENGDAARAATIAAEDLPTRK